MKAILFGIGLLLCFIPEYFADDISGCPPVLNDFIKYVKTFGKRCYFFVTYRQRGWTEANNECHLLGGWLVTVPNAETEKFLLDSLPAVHHSHNQVWIGLTDEHQEGEWVWTTGETVNYTAWAPEHTDKYTNDQEDCVALDKDQTNLWEDYRCDDVHFTYICEFDMKGVPNPVSVPAGITHFHVSKATHSTKAPHSTTPSLPTTVTEPTVTIATEPTAAPNPTVPQTEKATFPSFCGKFTCVLDCATSGFAVDIDGCPVCLCRS